MKKILFLTLFTIALISCASGTTEEQIAATIEIAMRQTVEAQSPTATIELTDTPVPTDNPKPTATPEPTSTTQPTDTPSPTATIPANLRNWATYTMLNGTEIIYPAGGSTRWNYGDEELNSVRFYKRRGVGTNQHAIIDFFDVDLSLDVNPEEYYRDFDTQEKVIKVAAASAMDNLSFDKTLREPLDDKGDQQLVIVVGTTEGTIGEHETRLPVYSTVIPNGDTSIIAVFVTNPGFPTTIPKEDENPLVEQSLRILQGNAWVIGRGRSLNK